MSGHQPRAGYDRACSCLEEASLHDDNHCCLRDAYDYDANEVTCGHQADWTALRVRRAEGATA